MCSPYLIVTKLFIRLTGSPTISTFTVVSVCEIILSFIVKDTTGFNIIFALSEMLIYELIGYTLLNHFVSLT